MEHFTLGNIHTRVCVQSWQSLPCLVQLVRPNVNSEGEASGSTGQLLPHIHTELGTSVKAVNFVTGAEWLSNRMLGKMHQFLFLLRRLVALWVRTRSLEIFLMPFN